MQDSVITETWTWKTEKETERRSEEHVFLMVFGIIDIAMILSIFWGGNNCGALDASRRHCWGDKKKGELCGSHRRSPSGDPRMRQSP